MSNADLDRWLAQHLMGWHELVDPEVPHPKIIEYRNGPAHDGPCEVYQFDAEADAELFVRGCDYVSFDSWGDIEWVPSERIWHAQQVWEKMRTKGFRVTMFIRKHPDLWTCHITWKGLSQIIAKDTHVTIETAVCRAVKKALEAVDG